MTYRRSNFEPGHVEPRGPEVRPYDAWQWIGAAAWAVAALLVVLEIASWFGLAFEREHPGALILLGLGGAILIGYRSTGGLLGSRTPGFRRGLGLVLAVPGLVLAGLELVP